MCGLCPIPIRDDEGQVFFVYLVVEGKKVGCRGDGGG